MSSLQAKKNRRKRCICYKRAGLGKPQRDDSGDLFPYIFPLDQVELGKNARKIEEPVFPRTWTRLSVISVAGYRMARLLRCL